MTENGIGRLSIKPSYLGITSPRDTNGVSSQTDKDFTQSLSVDGMFHNIRWTNNGCSNKAKMSALSKVEMSASAPFWEFGGCYFDGHGGDEQARAEPA